MLITPYIVCLFGIVLMSPTWQAPPNKMITISATLEQEEEKKLLDEGEKIETFLGN